jgi:hypothetical protein
MYGKPAKRSHGFTPKKREAFLTMLAEGFFVKDAAKQIGLSRRAVYNLRERDEEFRKAWEEALEEGTEVLEAEAYRRGMGWTETRHDKNGKPYEVYRYSDNLLMFMLKKRDPSYRDRVDVSITEERRIIVDLIRVVKDPTTGKLVLVEDDVPLLSAGE